MVTGLGHEPVCKPASPEGTEHLVECSRQGGDSFARQEIARAARWQAHLSCSFVTMPLGPRDEGRM